jgi:hypothetical protein
VNGTLRRSVVSDIKLNVVSFGSVVQFGDNDRTELRTRIIAIQRAVANFPGDLARLASYPLFFLPLPQFKSNANLTMSRVSDCPDIEVGSIHSIGVAQASCLRIGTGRELRAETRIVNIRNYNGPRDIR